MKILVDRKLLENIFDEVDGFLNGKPIEELYYTFINIANSLSKILQDNPEPMDGINILASNAIKEGTCVFVPPTDTSHIRKMLVE